MLTGALAFLTALLALLAVPVTLRFEIAWRQAFENNIELHWAFGLVRARIRSPRPRPSPPGDGSPGSSAVAAPSRDRWHPLAAIRDRRFRRRVTRFLGALWRALHKDDVRLRLRIGLGDPADTGRLWAVCGPLAGWLTTVREASISLEPAFVDATLEFDSSGSIRMVPLQILILTVSLLLSPAVWRGVRQMRAAGDR